MTEESNLPKSETNDESTDSVRVASSSEELINVKEKELVIPDKEFYVEFRVMTSPFPNENWSDWFFYPSSASLIQVKEALEKDGILFVNDVEEAKDAIRVDTMLNAKFLDLPHDVVAIRQDSEQIKNDLGFGPWDKIPARFAPSNQIRLMDNDIKNKLNPRTIKDIYEDMTGLSASKDVDSLDEEE